MIVFLTNGGMMAETEKIIAMAVAAIAEETGIEPERVVVRSFHEIQKSSLERYIEDNHIQYRKYELERCAGHAGRRQK